MMQMTDGASLIHPTALRVNGINNYERVYTKLHRDYWTKNGLCITLGIKETLMTSDDPRKTEERLRHHLDSNQVMRERLCLAVLPLVGPYTQERPRCPKGGPDGGRDLEAVFEGAAIAWGAVGFRNGGGNDNQARHDATKKFKQDLKRALEENSTLQAFVFFTNVDLTPSNVERLKEHASRIGVSTVDVVDFERLRHVLDSPEGLIARLQYLDIPMSATEQIALVNKFGNQLQSAVATRFDRVEQTLSQMERFLDFQKPLYRLDVYVSLEGRHVSNRIGDQGVLLKIDGLQDLGKTVSCLLWNHSSHKDSGSQLVTRAHLWLEEQKNKFVSFTPSLGPSLSLMTAYCELSLTTGGHRVRIADLSSVSLKIYVTEGLKPIARQLTIDANGYELFRHSILRDIEQSVVELPDNLPIDVTDVKWFEIDGEIRRDLTFEPPLPSGRLLPLRRTGH